MILLKNVKVIKDKERLRYCFRIKKIKTRITSRFDARSERFLKTLKNERRFLGDLEQRKQGSSFFQYKELYKWKQDYTQNTYFGENFLNIQKSSKE